MTFTSRILMVVGAILLAHSCYSAQEVSALLDSNVTSNTPVSSSPASSNPYPTLTSPHGRTFSSLPLDITLEVLASVAILCFGIVLGSEPLKPISWRVWAGKVEQQKHEKKDLGQATDEGFLWLENGRRKGFIDIRAQRKEFADWVRGQGQ